MWLCGSPQHLLQRLASWALGGMGVGYTVLSSTVLLLQEAALHGRKSTGSEVKTMFKHCFPTSLLGNFEKFLKISQIQYNRDKDTVVVGRTNNDVGTIWLPSPSFHWRRSSQGHQQFTCSLPVPKDIDESPYFCKDDKAQHFLQHLIIPDSNQLCFQSISWVHVYLSHHCCLHPKSHSL